MPTLISMRAGSCRRAFVPETVEILEAATVPVLSLAEARKHVKQEAWMGGDPAKPGVMGHPDDDEIMMAVAAATGEIEAPNGWLGRAIMPQTLMVRLERLEPIRIPAPPLLEIVSVNVEGEGGGWTFMAEDQWNVAGDGPHAVLEPARGVTWPSGRANVTFRAGYEPPAGAALINPELAAIKAWVKLRTHDLYVTGGTLSKMGEAPFAAHLLTNLRVRT